MFFIVKMKRETMETSLQVELPIVVRNLLFTYCLLTTTKGDRAEELSKMKRGKKKRKTGRG